MAKVEILKRKPKIATSQGVEVVPKVAPMITPTGRYLGSVGFQRLLRRPPATQVGDCVEASVFVRPDLPERELAARLAAYNLVRLPKLLVAPA